MRVLILASIAALAAACTQETPAPEAAAAPAPAEEQPCRLRLRPRTEGQIDWAKAQADFTSKRPADAPVSVQTAGQDGPSPVPMLLPSGIVQTASDRPVPPVVTKDGYFATYHLARYDATVNGSMKAYTGTGAPAGNKEAMKFTTGEATASAVLLALWRGLSRLISSAVRSTALRAASPRRKPRNSRRACSSPRLARRKDGPHGLEGRVSGEWRDETVLVAYGRNCRAWRDDAGCVRRRQRAAVAMGRYRGEEEETVPEDPNAPPRRRHWMR